MDEYQAESDYEYYWDRTPSDPAAPFKEDMTLPTCAYCILAKGDNGKDGWNGHVWKGFG
jgi:hypothetical protein